MRNTTRCRVDVMLDGGSPVIFRCAMMYSRYVLQAVFRDGVLPLELPGCRTARWSASAPYAMGRRRLNER